MPAFRTRVKVVRDRALADPVRQTADQASSEVLKVLGPELAELRRILADQGDAADEIAEITGRTLTRLSDEVADLRTELAAVHAKLETLHRETLHGETLQGEKRPG
jgi:predicted transcriptional regulator